MSKLYSDEEDVVIGAIDCDAHKDLCSEHNVQGFPTLKYFSGGVAEDYESGREIDKFVEFINAKTGLDLSSDGGVTDSAGIIHELEGHVDSYISATTADERSNVLNTCHKEVEGLDATAAEKFKYYTKVFAKIAEKGVAYIKAEKIVYRRYCNLPAV